MNVYVTKFPSHMWSEQDFAKALDFVGKGAAALSEAGSTVHRMSNAVQREGLSALFQSGPPCCVNIPTNPSLSGRADGVEENRAIIRHRLEQAMKEGNAERARLLSRDLDALEGLGPPTRELYEPARPAFGLMSRVEHPTQSMHSVFLAPHRKLTSTHGVPYPQGVKRDHYTVHKSQPTVSSPLAPNPSSPSYQTSSSSVDAPGRTLEVLRSYMPHSHPGRSACPDMMGGLGNYHNHSGEDAALFENDHPTPDAYVHGALRASAAATVASSYSPGYPHETGMVVPHMACTARQPTTCASQICLEGEVEQVDHLHTRTLVHRQSQVYTIRLDPSHAPGLQTLATHTGLPISVVVPAPSSRAAENGFTMDGVPSLEMCGCNETDTIGTSAKPNRSRSLATGRVESAQSYRPCSAADDDHGPGSALQDIYEVESVLDVRKTDGGQREYLLKWKDWAPAWNSWEPEQHILDKDMLRNFHKKRRAKKDADENDICVYSKRRCARHATVRAMAAARQENEAYDSSTD